MIVRIKMNSIKGILLYYSNWKRFWQQALQKHCLGCYYVDTHYIDFKYPRSRAPAIKICMASPGESATEKCPSAENGWQTPCWYMILAEAGRGRSFNFTLNRNNKLEKEKNSSEEDIKVCSVIIKRTTWSFNPPIGDSNQHLKKLIFCYITISKT